MISLGSLQNLYIERLSDYVDFPSLIQVLVLATLNI